MSDSGSEMFPYQLRPAAGKAPILRPVFGTGQLSAFEHCPVEILLAIFKLLGPSDLGKMMVVSKAFTHAVPICLYKCVKLRVSEINLEEELHLFMGARADNLRLVEEFSLLNTTRGRICTSSAGWASNGMWKQLNTYLHWATVLNERVVELVDKLGPNLHTLRWDHTFRMFYSTLAELLNKRPNLIHIHANEMMGRPFEISSKAGTALTALELRTIHVSARHISTSGISPAASVLVMRSGKNLKRLVLGNERWALTSKNMTTDFLADDGAKRIAPLDEIMKRISRGRNVLPSLSHLDLIAVQVSPSSPGAVDLCHTFDFNRLTRLSLESCRGTEALLLNLAIPDSPVTLNLKEFRIRHEAPSEKLLPALETFLSSFTGLELLSVLLDKTERMIDHKGFMRAHGPTLKVLVWEGRKTNKTLVPISLEVKREHNDPSEPFLVDLGLHCRNLRELSIPLNMRLPFETGIKAWRVLIGLPFQLLALPHLKTLHGRFLPFPRRNVVSTIFVVNANKSVATEYLDWGYHKLGRKPNLDLVALGAPTYNDRYLQDYGASDYRKMNILPPLFYDVQVVSNNLTGHNHFLNPLGERNGNGGNTDFIPASIDTIRETYPHTRVFESYWLK
ncbi:hypothetical protein AJ80_07412 [Polytolypa hystricis UAMH7299]|uniref:F-box domain-containing protein n=1 Tax=Polytolypa hystricis (strain UAMH7299) TaxID=1447883 RepID=A0A2B7XQ40_POLH7|nr:hypothetical protein AJ80_07412 [Polytolypa hystricis UAMH7299]